jgi:NAD(P)-dependent dehydrogenase (short-subunit alcohol dehydrogenase family)
VQGIGAWYFNAQVIQSLFVQFVCIQRVMPPVPGEATQRKTCLKGRDLEKAAVAQTPLGRTGQVTDIAPIAVFLASDDSQLLTGEQLLASGGFR